MGHAKDFLHSGNPKSLFSAFLYFDTSFMVWVLLGALGNFVASDLGLSGTEKGLMTALPVLSGAILRLPMGIAADRFGSRPVGMIGLALDPRAPAARLDARRLAGDDLPRRHHAGRCRCELRGCPAAGQPLVPAGAPGPRPRHRRRRQQRHRLRHRCSRRGWRRRWAGTASSASQ